MSWSRRRLLGAAGMIAGASAAGVLRGAAAETGDGSRRIVLKNLHTPESLDTVYRRGEDYVPEALSAIQTLLRDYRTGALHPIDPALMDYLYDVAHVAGAEPAFIVISGYRSPQTNEMLHERSSGVSSHSLHMEGRAIDVRLAGIDCAKLAGEALSMKRGGVGYYKKSDFVHLDTGRFRTWRG
jgi:uncharacterized protein YcbK (DUF882 family)